MNPKLKAALDRLREKNSQVNKLLDSIGDAEMTTEQKSQLDTLEKGMADDEAEVADFKSRADLREKANARNAYLNDPVNRPAFDAKGENADDVTREVSRTLGRDFAESAEYKEWLGRVAPSGRVAEKQLIQSPAVSFKGLNDLRERALVTGSSPTSGGAMLRPERLPGYVDAAPFRLLTVRELMTVIETTSDAVEYVQVTGYTNNAAPVAEAISAGEISAVAPVVTPVQAGLKPESGLSTRVVKDTIKTIAHWIPATTRALMDAPQLEGLINAFLLYGLKEKSENLMVTGDGTGENFTGILNTPGIQAQAYDTDMLATLRKARTKIRLNARVTPTAYLMNPLDWEKIDLSKDLQGRYYFGGPTELGNPRVWGLPVVENEAVPEGMAVVAAWNYGVLYDRMQGTLAVSNQHADFFIRNLIAILAEIREGFGIQYTKAFCSIDLTP